MTDPDLQTLQTLAEQAKATVAQCVHDVGPKPWTWNDDVDGPWACQQCHELEPLADGVLALLQRVETAERERDTYREKWQFYMRTLEGLAGNHETALNKLMQAEARVTALEGERDELRSSCDRVAGSVIAIRRLLNCGPHEQTELAVGKLQAQLTAAEAEAQRLRARIETLETALTDEVLEKAEDAAMLVWSGIWHASEQAANAAYFSAMRSVLAAALQGHDA